MKYGSIKDWVTSTRNRLREDWDQVTLITGAERSGKSTLGIRLNHELDPGFTPARIAFAGGQYLRVAKDAPRYGAVQWDEVIEGAFSLDALDGLNKEIAKFLTICGERNLVSTICFPNKNWLQPILREHRVRTWFHVPRRGQAILYEPQRSEHSRETYWAKKLRFDYAAVRGPAWEAYLARKREYTQRFGRDDSKAEEHERLARQRGDMALRLTFYADALRDWKPPSGTPAKRARSMLRDVGRDA